MAGNTTIVRDEHLAKRSLGQSPPGDTVQDQYAVWFSGTFVLESVIVGV